MKKLRTIALFSLTVLVLFLQACSSSTTYDDDWNETNKPRGMTGKEKKQKAMDKRSVKNIEEAELMLVPTGKKVYVIDPDTQEMVGTLTNPHPDEAQYVVAWDNCGNKLWEGSVASLMIQHFTFPGSSGDDYYVRSIWKNARGDKDTTDWKYVPDAPAEVTDRLGNKTHVNFDGFGKYGYKEKEGIFQYQGEKNNYFYYRLESNPDPKN